MAATIPLHVFVRANSADDALLALFDDAAVHGWTVVDHRTYRVDSHLSADEVADGYIKGMPTAIAIAYRNEGAALYHIDARVRQPRS